MYVCIFMDEYVVFIYLFVLFNYIITFFYDIFFPLLFLFVSPIKYIK